MTNEPQNRDGIRDWIDYEGHTPQPYEGAQNLGRIGAIFANLLATEYRCAICNVEWPCVEAVRRERDYAETEATRRGDVLRSRGIPVEPGNFAHSDSATPLGRAIQSCHAEILRRRCERAMVIASQQVNLYSWHPNCNHQCSGRNHVEVLLVKCDSDTRAHQAQLITQVIRDAYGAIYQHHELMLPHEQQRAKREYASRMFNTSITSDGKVTEDHSPADYMLAYTVRFVSGAPLDTLRDFIADQASIEVARDAGDKR